MNMRLTSRDLERVDAAKKYFASLRPVPLHLTSAGVVRIAIRDMLDRIEGRLPAGEPQGPQEQQAA